MREKNIVIVGGSIAGCAMAVLLHRLGAKVTVLERSLGQISQQGAGIMLPIAVIDQCIALDLFDQDTPRFVMHSRSFSRKLYSASTAEKFWEQAIQGAALNWMDVYRNLRKRLAPDCYQTQKTVQHIQKNADGYDIRTSDGKIIFADMVIAADGVDSTIRAQLIPNTKEAYAGYVAWRGVLDDATLNTENHVPYYVFQNGHMLLYRIPASDYATTKKTLLNWLIYENNPAISLCELLKDKNGQQHTRSISAGNLHHDQKEYLHLFARKNLPTAIADIVRQTLNPFVQTIFDFQLPAYAANNIIFAGDAAATLRPHSGSGVLKALMNAITFYTKLSENSAQDLSTMIAQWKILQTKANSDEIQKANMMGRALVTHSPDWNALDQASTDQWWNDVMQGKTWYATESVKSQSLFQEKISSSENTGDKKPVFSSKL